MYNYEVMVEKSIFHGTLNLYDIQPLSDLELNIIICVNYMNMTTKYSDFVGQGLRFLIETIQIILCETE